jgi:hypothetical protein
MSFFIYNELLIKKVNFIFQFATLSCNTTLVKHPISIKFVDICFRYSVWLLSFLTWRVIVYYSEVAPIS